MRRSKFHRVYHRVSNVKHGGGKGGGGGGTGGLSEADRALLQQTQQQNDARMAFLEGQSQQQQSLLQQQLAQQQALAQQQLQTTRANQRSVEDQARQQALRDEANSGIASQSALTQQRNMNLMDRMQTRQQQGAALELDRQMGQANDARSTMLAKLSANRKMRGLV